MKHTLKGLMERTSLGEFIVYLDGGYLSPRRSQKVFNHSPDGFAWGYGGSGPAQLALAILLEVTTKKEALSNYQQFKWNFIAKLPREDFEIDFEWPAEKTYDPDNPDHERI